MCFQYNHIHSQHIWERPILESTVAGSNASRLTEHLLLHWAAGIIQKQKELLEEELQMGSVELGVVLAGQTGQPESDGFESGTAHFFAAIVQPLQ